MVWSTEHLLVCRILQLAPHGPLGRLALDYRPKLAGLHDLVIVRSRCVRESGVGIWSILGAFWHTPSNRDHGVAPVERARLRILARTWLLWRLGDARPTACHAPLRRSHQPLVGGLANGVRRHIRSHLLGEERGSERETERSLSDDYSAVCLSLGSFSYDAYLHECVPLSISGKSAHKYSPCQL